MRKFLRRRPASESGDHWVPIETARLLLRFTMPIDEHGVRATIDDEVIRRNGLAADFQPVVCTMIAEQKAWTLRIIWDRELGRIVGCAVVTRVAGFVDRCTLGFWIGPEFRRRGYATEAVAALVPALHREGLHRIEAVTSVDNEPTMRLLRANGFACVARRPHTLPDDSVIDAYVFEHARMPQILAAAG